MALYFSSILDLNRLFDGLIDKDISKVDLLLCKIGLRPESFSLQLQRKAFFCTRDVAISHAIISVGLSGHKGHSNGDFTVGPDFSNQRFNFEDIILK
jgi:hypothetical protein